MNPYEGCTLKCERTPNCTVCGMRKFPLGRSVAPAMAGGGCDWDCPGYREEPYPGHLWPGELLREERERIERLHPCLDELNCGYRIVPCCSECELVEKELKAWYSLAKKELEDDSAV